MAKVVFTANIQRHVLCLFCSVFPTPTSPSQTNRLRKCL